jgi:hypothetical protein
LLVSISDRVPSTAAKAVESAEPATPHLLPPHNPVVDIRGHSTRAAITAVGKN